MRKYTDYILNIAKNQSLKLKKGDNVLVHYIDGFHRGIVKKKKNGFTIKINNPRNKMFWDILYTDKQGFFFGAENIGVITKL